MKFITFFVAEDKEAKIDQFYEDLENLLGLTSKKDVLFITGDWKTK